MEEGGGDVIVVGELSDVIIEGVVLSLCDVIIEGVVLSLCDVIVVE